MNGIQEPSRESAPSDQVRAEAAAWIAQLHDDRRSPRLEARVHAWLAESEVHRHAFNRMTQVWEQTAAIQLRARNEIPSARRHRRLVLSAATAAAAIALTGIAVTYFWRGDDVATDIGQQEARLLPDGTRVMLNTDTRIEVAFDKRTRRVRLIHGEAWFDVSKRPTWPFVVQVDGREIRALGTSFVVRHDDIQAFSVTLLEGQISVGPVPVKEGTSPQHPETLVPGQRLTISPNHPSIVDRPEIDRVTAWERGRVEFEDTTLGDAADEMNRYSAAHIVVTDTDVARLRIGGVFRAGDSDEFVRIVTTAFGLHVAYRAGEIVVSRPESAPPPAQVP